MIKDGITAIKYLRSYGIRTIYPSVLVDRLWLAAKGRAIMFPIIGRLDDNLLPTD